MDLHEVRAFWVLGGRAEGLGCALLAFFCCVDRFFVTDLLGEYTSGTVLPWCIGKLSLKPFGSQNIRSRGPGGGQIQGHESAPDFLRFEVRVKHELGCISAPRGPNSLLTKETSVIFNFPFCGQACAGVKQRQCTNLHQIARGGTENT